MRPQPPVFKTEGGSSRHPCCRFLPTVSVATGSTQLRDQCTAERRAKALVPGGQEECDPCLSACPSLPIYDVFNTGSSGLP